MSFADVLSQSRLYTNISETRRPGFNNISKCLQIVKKFIVKHKLLVYGGLCIDQALKMRNHPGIYTEDMIPDYDVMDPEFYAHSNELATELHKAGIPEVHVIMAAHPITRRVRVGFDVVADFSYIPTDVFERLSYLTSDSPDENYSELRLVHPDFQRIDLHRSICFLFNRIGGSEVFYHRFAKDVKRFRMLDEIYPLHPKGKPPGGDTHELQVKIPDTPGVCVLSGLAAYALFYTIVSDIKVDPGIIKIYLTENLKIVLPKHLDYKNTYIIGSEYISDVLRKIGCVDNYIYRRAFMDFVILPGYEFGDFLLQEIESGCLSVYDLQKCVAGLGKNPKFSHSVSVINALISRGCTKIVIPGYLLMEFLALQYVDKHNEDNDTPGNLYVSLTNLIKIAEDYVSENSDYFDCLPLFVSSEHYVDLPGFGETFMLLENYSKLYDIPGYGEFRGMIPSKRYYPENGPDDSTFTPGDNNPIFNNNYSIAKDIPVKLRDLRGLLNKMKLK